VEDSVSVDARAATFTVPEEAAEFVEKTGVDSLAVAIGTSHGAYKFKGEPYLDFQRLSEIHKLIPDTPLVLHGASSVLPEYIDQCNAYGGAIPSATGVPESMIKEAAKYGICKVNVDTDIKLAMTAAVRKQIAEDTSSFDPRKYLGAGRDLIIEMIRHKMQAMLGSSGRR
jgi:fructose-bisphosphate aldolase class II